MSIFQALLPKAVFYKCHIFTLLAVSVIWQSPGLMADERDNEGWRELFNGRDLSGWKANVAPESFSVHDGAIKAHGKTAMSHLFFIGHQQPFEAFKDFEIELVARGKPNSNSGLFIHTGYDLRRKKYLAKGYEVQLNSTEKEKRKTGSLYAVADLDQSPVDETEWFTVRVRVEGKQIRVWLNDKLVNDYTEPESPIRAPDRAHRLIDPEGGAIALQAHDPQSVFYFRSIRIREL
ncbi:DUF1080 domain-containing protein [Stieleria sp. JC731]|uniref:3-keto-disaccharide hydrolase n=1 Tax=Pirellulaceae TaxID=2691357 RepID=UPI001E2964AE|nr:DUF1080 domain-containing protein [Stieleria sp. JC731]MCC9603558.1 DUF1080 domain-containing protein [Stieleria sp. JC731]